ncbi:MLP-like protein 423 [Manihot esculenta]|uniref:Bet v I/Major latex protein domain-containing protein n=1 Tax=Manihot esculenta TaxID=3983 RepID=A0A2C9VUM8_MANES|nr:MLP-like protein 423 [Manihot esculenta]OAY49862.1 hypothetical protein MANES_05G089900v8 [Manihot esculenta]
MSSSGNTPYTVTVENTIMLQSSEDQLTNFFTQAAELLPKYLPNIYKKITPCQSSKGVYTFKIEYANGCPIETETDQIDKLDLEKLQCFYSVIDGDVLKYYKNLKVTVTLYPQEKGCKVKRAYEYEKVDNSFAPAFFEFEIAVLIQVDQVIQNAPTKKY